MANYGSGTYTLYGALYPVTATVDTDAIVTFDLCGVGTFNISSNSGSTVTVNADFSVLDCLNFDTKGGTISLGSVSGSLDQINVIIDGGGTFNAGGSTIGCLNDVDITYCSGGGTFIVDTINPNGHCKVGYGFGDKTTLEFSNFNNSSDVIDNPWLTFGGLKNYVICDSGRHQTVTFNDQAGWFVFEVEGNNLQTGTFTTLTGGPLKVSADGVGGTDISVCFLAGTQIATPRGEVPVESLGAGALVSIWLKGGIVTREVTWAGSRNVTLPANAGDDMFPVRIRAGAFADGIPRRDLLVTPEHCIFTEDRLIPARMLVNGGSIVIAREITSYSYYHLELERHGILLANGLTAESYLDTGNRGNFANAAATSLRPDFTMAPFHSNWAEHAAAPLAVDRATVEPIWQRLLQRATAIGLAAGQTQLTLTDDPELCLTMDNGQVIRPSAVLDDRIYRFMIPGGAAGLRLLSRAARPSDVAGPFVDDRRRLGVLVGAIQLGSHGKMVPFQSHLAQAKLRGWHQPEASSAARWTDGDAALPLDLSALRGMPVRIEVEVLNAGPYPAGPLPGDRSRRAA